jgi:hypothetical protein
MPPATFKCTIAIASGSRLTPKTLNSCHRVSKMPYQRPEPCAPKGACTVLRGPSVGNRARLPDQYGLIPVNSASAPVAYDTTNEDAAR